MKKVMHKIAIAFVFAIYTSTYVSAQTDKFGRNYEDKVTSGGLAVSADISGFMLKGIGPVSSKPGAGVTGGGFIDFKMHRHLIMQMGLMLNYNTIRIINQESPVNSDYSSCGMEIPLYIMGRFITANNSILYAGIGVYTEFVLGCKLQTGDEIVNPYKQVVGSDASGKDVLALSDNNTGLRLKFCYEFPFRLQLFATTGMSISDIQGYVNQKGHIKPYKTSFGIAYRFR